MSVKLAISGCSGRMGRAIAALALQDSAFAVAAALEAAGHEAVGHDYGTVLGRPASLGLPVIDDAERAVKQADVFVDFTRPEATIEHLRLAKAHKRAMVIGTTGLSETHIRTLQDAAASIPIVFSPNMSVGVNVLFEIARAAAQRLGAAFDVEVIESHHRGKTDSPSGTALRLAEVLAAARGQAKGSIPVHAVRAGEIVGDHTVILAGPSERLELTHRAQSREVFARGALRAAQFVHRRAPGLYDMSHVLAASS
jgi:4-hydroxy-tetrahydrodipicolinate reductase